MPIKTMPRPRCLLALTLATVSATAPPARAGDAGRREFPATLVVEEPQVETEISPQAAAFGAGAGRRFDGSSDLSLKVAKAVSVILNPDYTLLRPGGQGFQALEIGMKLQFVADAERELVLSAGLLSTLGGTGSVLVDADRTTSVIPTLYYGKGGGDLPAALAWARPFAVTGQIGLVVPTRRHSGAEAIGQPVGGAAGEISEGASGELPEGAGEGGRNPVLLALAGSLQYSLPYASETLRPLPRALASLVPLVEYEIAVPVANRDARARVVGTVDPGVLYIDAASGITYGLEMLIPINRASGTHPGARLQLSYSFETPWPLAGRAPGGEGRAQDAPD